MTRTLTFIGVFLLVMFSTISVTRADSVGDLEDYAEISQQRAQPPTDISMAVDILIARPLLFVASVIGTGLFVISLPLSMMGGNTEEAADKLVVTPVRATFFRCLGCDGGVA